MFLKHEIHHLREKSENFLYFLFRVLIGLLFFLHGASKLFGWYAPKGPVPLTSLFGVAGIIETIAGILLIVGLWTRIAAFFAAIEMLVAYFKVHLPQGWIPLVNQGELAVLFFAAFLVLIIHGSGKWSLHYAFFK